MIQANELRIDNLFEYEGFIYSVKVIRDNFIYGTNNNGYAPGEFPISKINPIELTEEWLIKFGFKSRKGSATLYLTDQSYWNRFLRIEDHYTDKCKYVHQLQNLYFCLTGEELTIKP